MFGCVAPATFRVRKILEGFANPPGSHLCRKTGLSWRASRMGSQPRVLLEQLQALVGIRRLSDAAGLLSFPWAPRGGEAQHAGRVFPWAGQPGECQFRVAGESSGAGDKGVSGKGFGAAARARMPKRTVGLGRGQPVGLYSVKRLGRPRKAGGLEEATKKPGRPKGKLRPGPFPLGFGEFHESKLIACKRLWSSKGILACRLSPPSLRFFLATAAGATFSLNETLRALGGHQGDRVGPLHPLDQHTLALVLGARGFLLKSVAPRARANHAFHAGFRCARSRSSAMQPEGPAVPPFRRRIKFQRPRNVNFLPASDLILMNVPPSRPLDHSRNTARDTDTLFSNSVVAHQVPIGFRLFPGIAPKPPPSCPGVVVTMIVYCPPSCFFSVASRVCADTIPLRKSAQRRPEPFAPGRPQFA